MNCERCRHWTGTCLQDEECMYHVTNTDKKIDFPKIEENNPDGELDRSHDGNMTSYNHPFFRAANRLHHEAYKNLRGMGMNCTTAKHWLSAWTDELTTSEP